MSGARASGSRLVRWALLVGVGAFVGALVWLPSTERGGGGGGGEAGWGEVRATPPLGRRLDAECDPGSVLVEVAGRFNGEARWDALMWGELGWLFRAVGMEESARGSWELARRLMEVVVTIDGGTGTDWYNLACFRALCGAEERALSALRRAVLLGWVDVEYAREDRDLAGLRGLAGFEEALRGE